MVCEAAFFKAVIVVRDGRRNAIDTLDRTPSKTVMSRCAPHIDATFQIRPLEKATPFARGTACVSSRVAIVPTDGNENVLVELTIHVLRPGIRNVTFVRRLSGPACEANSALLKTMDGPRMRLSVSVRADVPVGL